MALIPTEIERGRQESAADIASGSPKLFWQVRGAWGELLARLMTERFGVAVQHISDITNWAEKSYRQGYNDATVAHLDELFGRNSYQALLDEVDRFRELRYQQYRDSKKR